MDFSQNQLCPAAPAAKLPDPQPSTASGSRAGGAGIDVWLAFYREPSYDALSHSPHELLDAQEHEQCLRFRSADDRRCYLVTRALERTVLSRYVSHPPREWRFGRNSFGRPYIRREIVSIYKAADDLRFNVSHTGGLIAFAITWGREIGVDVENMDTRVSPVDIADRFFAPGEAAALARIDPARRQYRFFEYWTFKEAYIKARGLGLSLPLDKFSFQYPDEHSVRFSVDPDLGDDADRWRFWQYRPTPSHLLAICAERSPGPAPSLRIHRAVPTKGSQKLTLLALRSSQLHD